MNVLVFLPPAGGSIDTMTEVVLQGRRLSRGGKDNWKDTDLSVLVSRDISPFKFSLATTSATTDGFEHDGCMRMPTIADSVIVTYSHGCTGLRQVPDDRGWEKPRVRDWLLLSSACVPPFRSSFFSVPSRLSWRGSVSHIRVLKYHG